MHTHRWSFIISIGILFVAVALPSHLVYAACPLPNGGNVSIGANTCTISSVTGSDSATVTLDNVSSSVTINNGGTLCLGSLVVSAGSTAIQVGGTIKTSCSLYVTDADSDSYPPDLNLSLTSGVGLRRLSLMTSLSTLDCNDANAATYANLTCYPDADGDTYYSTTSHSVCAGASCAAAGESATVGTDCCDSDINTYPLMSTFKYTTNACGNWNWDCSETTETERGVLTGGLCCTCTSDGAGHCVASSCIDTRWVTSNPGCGGSGDYVSANGYCQDADYPSCVPHGCVSGTVQQGCH